MIIGISIAALRISFIAPYEPKWNRDHGDTRVVALHLIVSHTLI